MTTNFVLVLITGWSVVYCIIGYLLGKYSHDEGPLVEGFCEDDEGDWV